MGKNNERKNLILNGERIDIVKYVLLLIFLQYTSTKSDAKYNPLAAKKKTTQNIFQQTNFPIEKTDEYKHKVQNAYKHTCFSPVSVCTCLGEPL